MSGIHFRCWRGGEWGSVILLLSEFKSDPPWFACHGANWIGSSVTMSCSSRAAPWDLLRYFAFLRTCSRVLCAGFITVVGGGGGENGYSTLKGGECVPGDDQIHTCPIGWLITLWDWNIIIILKQSDVFTQKQLRIEFKWCSALSVFQGGMCYYAVNLSTETKLSFVWYSKNACYPSEMAWTEPWVPCALRGTGKSFWYCFLFARRALVILLLEGRVVIHLSIYMTSKSNIFVTT